MLIKVAFDKLSCWSVSICLWNIDLWKFFQVGSEVIYYLILIMNWIINEVLRYGGLEFYHRYIAKDNFD